MARRMEVKVEDDVTGGPAVETMLFGFEGVSYEIDLNEENAEKFRSQITHWAHHARKTGGRRRAPQAISNDASEKRAWLMEHGHPVSERGRISAELEAIYAKAHANN